MTPAPRTFTTCTCGRTIEAAVVPEIVRRPAGTYAACSNCGGSLRAIVATPPGDDLLSEETTLSSMRRALEEISR